jgi:DNA-nicking Smr family endonuclease
MGRRRIPPPASPAPPTSLPAAVVEDERDLHQLTAAEAALELERFLADWSRRRPGAVLRVVTGRGAHSPSGPVLRPLVGQLLAGRLARFVEDFAAEAGGGAFRVRVRGERR